LEYKDYYAALGVPRTASQADIKKAFRKLARESHPDRHPGDETAERRFKDINEANEVLSDPDKRKLYDQLGSNWETYARAGAGAGAAGGSPYGGTGFGGFPGGIRYEFRTSGDTSEFSDFFNMFFGGAAEGFEAGRRGRSSGADTLGFGDILSGMGLGGRSATDRGPLTRRPGPIEAEAEITLEEAFRGTKRLLEVDGRRLEVSIPKGVTTGSRVRLKGQAPGGRDLVVVVRVAPHPTFARKGRDLEAEVPISLAEALLGGQVPVATLKGRVLLTIPPGTQTGRRFRLARQGMPALKGDDVGDLYVRARVVLPTHLSEEAQAAARAFLDLVDQPEPRAERPSTATPMSDHATGTSR
jgi:curved DNA-binding protein